MGEPPAILPDLVINGRFLTRPMTGVDRFATELTRALASVREASGSRFRIDIAVPLCRLSDQAIRALLGLGSADRILRSRLTGYFWEQGVLARLAPQSMLISPCNIGPVARRKQVLVIHDAQVFDAPESYSRPFRLAYRLLQRPLARRAAVLATVSGFSRDRLSAHGIDGGRQIAIVPNGSDHMERLAADDEVVERLGIARGEYFLTLAGRARHKNMVVLARACALGPAEGLPLVVAGATDEAFAKGSGRPARAVGRVTDGELKSLLTHARGFLFPSLTEGFGLPAVEAMACGSPVVASTGGALPEVCGDAAILCDPDDPQAWAAAMSTLETDDLEARRLAKASSERAGRFRWEESARKLLAVIGAAGQTP